MSKYDNLEVNFSLKGNASIQIGIYFLLAAYMLKSIFSGFLIDDNAFGMLSAQIIEVASFSIVFLALLFSGLALYFKAKRNAKRNNYQLWNKKTKATALKVFLGFIVLFSILLMLMQLGEINIITSVFLVCYGLVLFLVKNENRKNILIISLACFLLAAFCYFIPTYWYSSIFILGIAHITYGIMIRK